MLRKVNLVGSGLDYNAPKLMTFVHWHQPVRTLESGWVCQSIQSGPVSAKGDT